MRARTCCNLYCISLFLLSLFFDTELSISLSFYLKLRGRKAVDFTNFTIRTALNGARRICAKGRGKSGGLFPQDLLLIFKKIDVRNVNHLIFWAALCFAFRSLLRSSNYCFSRHTMRVRDVIFVKHGIVLKVKSSKTNQFNEYVSEIPIYSNCKSVICPVSWLV